MRSARQLVLGVTVVAAAATVTVAAVPSPPQANNTFAYVSTEAILRLTPGFTAAESTLTAEVAVMRAELEDISRRLDSALTAFNQASIALSPSARQERQTELQQLNAEYQRRTTDAQAAAETRQRELMAPLQERIASVIDGIRAERNLGIVFDVAALGSNIVSADPALDLTGLVVQRLQGGQ